MKELDQDVDYEALAQYFANGESDGETPEIASVVETVGALLEASKQTKEIHDSRVLAAFIQSYVGPALLNGADPNSVFSTMKRFLVEIN